MHALVEPLFCRRSPQAAPIVHTQNMAIGLNLYLGSQSIFIVGFVFPTIGDPMLDNLSTLLFPQTPFFYLRVTPFFLLMVVLLPPYSLKNYQPLFLILLSYL